MTNHKKKKAQHNRLCFIVADHLKRYDLVMVNQPFHAWGREAGDHDVLGLKYKYGTHQVEEVVSYEIKGRHTERGYLKARRQTAVKQQAMNLIYPGARINTLYVAPRHVERIR